VPRTAPTARSTLRTGMSASTLLPPWIAGRARSISVPVALSRAALAELRERGSLTVKLFVHFGDANPKAVSIALRTINSKNGGRS